MEDYLNEPRCRVTEIGTYHNGNTMEGVAAEENARTVPTQIYIEQAEGAIGRIIHVEFSH